MKKQAKPHIFGAAPVGQALAASPLERQIALTLYAKEDLSEAEKFTRALTLSFPSDGFGWKVFGSILTKMGRVADSLEPLQKAAALLPMDWEAFNNLGCTHHSLGNHEYAEACYRRAIELKPDFNDALGNLAEFLCERHRYDDALVVYRQKLAHAPEDGYSRHMIAKFTGENTERAPSKYVSTVFDLYAETFEKHLTSTLNYRAPEELAQLIKKHGSPGERKQDILDLGCGTGLVGAAVASWKKTLVGIDLSSKMLNQTRARGVYDRLVCDDLLAAMQKEPSESYDAITAADVFIYIGKLDEVVEQARRLLRPKGLIAFSIEVLQPVPGEDKAYQLEASGRYSQALSYMTKLSNEHDLTVLEMRPSVIRTEHEQPVNGYLVVWQR